MKIPTVFKRGFSGSTLKIIAMLTMLCDHSAMALIPMIAGYNGDGLIAAWSDDPRLWTVYHVMRNIGRVAFPIFCYLLVEGFVHTSSRQRYAGRLALLAGISELPFDWAVTPRYLPWADPGMWDVQNVFFTLLLGLLGMMGIAYLQKALHQWQTHWWFPLLTWFGAAPLALIAEKLHTDYGAFGVMFIALLYVMREDRIWQTILGAVAILWEVWAPLAFIPLWFYNGKRGLPLKWVFYFFYPVHLALLGMIGHFLLLTT